MVITPKLIYILLAGAALVLLVFWWFRGDTNQQVISTIPPRAVLEEGIKIIAMGDSLTAGYGLSQSESYPAQLAVALKERGHNVNVINSGVSGETTRGNLERAEFIRSQNPDIVLLGIGGNDALRALPISETKKNLEATVAILKSGDNPPVIILLQMQSPLNAGLAYKKEFDKIYEQIATSQGLILVPFLTAEVFLKSENKLADGIHLNQVGYNIIVQQYLLPVLETVIGKLVK